MYTQDSSPQDSSNLEKNSELVQSLVESLNEEQRESLRQILQQEEGMEKLVQALKPQESKTESKLDVPPLEAYEILFNSKDSYEFRGSKGWCLAEYLVYIAYTNAHKKERRITYDANTYKWAYTLMDILIIPQKEPTYYLKSTTVGTLLDLMLLENEDGLCFKIFADKLSIKTAKDDADVQESLNKTVESINRLVELKKLGSDNSDYEVFVEFLKMVREYLDTGKVPKLQDTREDVGF